MAQVLLDKGVQQEAIYFLTLIASRAGIARVCRRFPAAKVITTAIDDALDDERRVKPGVGEFGDRFALALARGARGVSLFRCHIGPRGHAFDCVPHPQCVA